MHAHMCTHTIPGKVAALLLLLLLSPLHSSPSPVEGLREKEPAEYPLDSSLNSVGTFSSSTTRMDAARIGWEGRGHINTTEPLYYHVRYSVVTSSRSLPLRLVKWWGLTLVS